MFVKINDKLTEIFPETISEEIPVELQIDELKQKLSDTDYIACKIAEGAATTEEYADELKQRQIWREEINKLSKK